MDATRYTNELDLAIALAALPPGKVMGGLSPSARTPSSFGWCTLRHLRYRLDPDTPLAVAFGKYYIDTVIVEPTEPRTDWLLNSRRCSICNRPIADHLKDTQP